MAQGTLYSFTYGQDRAATNDRIWALGSKHTIENHLSFESVNWTGKLEEKP